MDLAIRDKALAIWRFSDHKPGHDSQSLGLGRALARQTDGRLYDLDCLAVTQLITGLARGHIPRLQALPAPDLIIGAGHGTHLSLLAARALCGGKTVVLMQPSLPTAWFDLCLVPAHDRPRQQDNIIITDGALNMMEPATDKDPDAGVILVGGPSRHHCWDDTGVTDQIRAIIEGSTLRWVLTDSARTPDGTRRLLRGMAHHGLSYHPREATGPEWVKSRLATAGTAWVTADSMSMVYEALTAGATVGILAIPVRHNGRTVKAIEQLAHEDRVTTFSKWQSTREMGRPGNLHEAGRCAVRVLQKLMTKT